jgi:hypothetical protein
MQKTNHIWNFSTVGGVKRVNLESGADLIHLDELDQKLWTALSCPVNGLEIDHKTLELIDTDNDSKIRVPEIIQAVKWITSVLKNPDDLLKQDKSLPLSAINDETELGKALISSARTILKNLGKEKQETISVKETSNTKKIFAASRLNGDGVITEDTSAEPAVIQVINEIMGSIGSATDLGGKQGITQEHLLKFIESCELYNNWHTKIEADRANILPYGDGTAEAYSVYTLIKSKVDDFFIRCRLAAFDPQSTEVLNLMVARVETITAKDLSTCLEEIATYPLAKIEANKALPLSTGINPAWENSIAKFHKLITGKLFAGKNSITETEWNQVSDSFTAFIKWQNEKEGFAVESLGLERIKAILASDIKDQLNTLIEQDKALETEANSIILVDQLVRYYRDLFKLLKNFVTFYDFYSPGSKAIFQAGTLYIDQRSCDLCIEVSDMGKHATMVSYSGMFLLYCDCISKSSNEKKTIVAALTNGDIDNLVVGRNALFYDRDGLDWDATVVKIVDNPISIRQAFYSPYRKVSRFIETQINKVAAAQDNKVTENATKTIEEVPVKAEAAAAPKPPAQPFDVGKFVGIFAAIGLALGAIGTVIASIVAGFMGLVWWKMPFAIIGLLLLISGPAMIMAYLKLRKRNLAPLLDANGWAINATAIVNIQFGNTLTHLADLPKGAKINLNDPFTKKKRPFFPILIIMIVIASVVLYFLWRYGYIHINI